jgi:hypothetical protein
MVRPSCKRTALLGGETGAVAASAKEVDPNLADGCRQSGRYESWGHPAGGDPSRGLCRGHFCVVSDPPDRSCLLVLFVETLSLGEDRVGVTVIWA